MDKVLEKINKLKQKLDELYIEMDNIEADINFNTNERELLFAKDVALEKEVKKLNSEKKKIEDILKNIKKWKRNTTLKAILSLLGFLALTMNFSIQLGFSFASLIILGAGILFTGALVQTGPYFSAKKYLKTHNLEEIEKTIEENQKNISLNDEKISVLSSKIQQLYDAEADMRYIINRKEDELRQLENLRIAVINKYLNNNQEFENIANEEYELHKQKKPMPKR